jgi:hypothetical protein
MRTVRMLLFGAGVLISLAGSAQSQLTNDLRDALNALDPVTQKVVSQCTIDGVKYLFAAVTVPQAQQNPFTPMLTPGGSPAPGSVIGYYQFALYLSQYGHYISRMTFPAQPLTNADQLNGIDSRYQVDLYAKAYRIYDTRTGRWSDWTTAGSFGNDVHYASFTLQRRQGVWQIEGGFLINTNGTLTAANCAALPPL